MPSREQVIAWRDSIVDGCIIEPDVWRFVQRNLPFFWQNHPISVADAREVCDRWLEMNLESSGEALRRAIREARS